MLGKENQSLGPFQLPLVLSLFASFQAPLLLVLLGGTLPAVLRPVALAPPVVLRPVALAPTVVLSPVALAPPVLAAVQSPPVVAAVVFDPVAFEPVAVAFDPTAFDPIGGEFSILSEAAFHTLGIHDTVGAGLGLPDSSSSISAVGGRVSKKNWGDLVGLRCNN